MSVCVVTRCYEQSGGSWIYCSLTHPVLQFDTACTPV
jgi:hypothetical protein